ncbi:MAG: hypothetical protein IID01_05030 [Chloroflexi bacterium]|nr:hypothetical protein [Chloroflexota bacterium]
MLLIGLACGGDGGDNTVTGLVIEAVERDLVEIELLRVRDGDGKVWEFSTDGPVGISASHLRQHQVLGESVVVTYRKYRGSLIATDVRDVTGPGG